MDSTSWYCGMVSTVQEARCSGKMHSYVMPQTPTWRLCIYISILEQLTGKQNGHRDNGAPVDLGSHTLFRPNPASLDCNCGQESRESHVPHRQSDGEGESVVHQDPLVVHDDRS